MHIFFSRDITDREIRLDPTESSHAIRVLRLSSGDTIQVLDGQGNIYTGRIKDPNPRKVVTQITNHQSLLQRAPYYLHIAIAPTKNINRFEFFLEKAIETGIDEITPLLCEHSERNKIRINRLEKIAITAIKQSGQPFLPRINHMVPFFSFIRQNFSGDRFIAHCCMHEKATRHFYHTIDKDHLLLLIGPEGDFSRKELDQAVENDYHPVSLGHTRLRTETAGIAGAIIAAVKFFNTIK